MAINQQASVANVLGDRPKLLINNQASNSVLSKLEYLFDEHFERGLHRNHSQNLRGNIAVERLIAIIEENKVASKSTTYTNFSKPAGKQNILPMLYQLPL